MDHEPLMRTVESQGMAKMEEGYALLSKVTAFQKKENLIMGIIVDKEIVGASIRIGEAKDKLIVHCDSHGEEWCPHLTAIAVTYLRQPTT